MKKAKFIVVFLIVGAACRMLWHPAHIPPAAPQPPAYQAERDEIFTLAAYSLVLKQHQYRVPAGNYVAAILVRGDDIQEYGLNANAQKRQSLYHAEMNLTLRYLDKASRTSKSIVNLGGATVYTSLEPCLMCYGTLRMLRAGRVVYGQTDPYLGAGSRLFNHPDSYAIKMTLDKAPTSFFDELDAAFKASRRYSIIQWLATPEAQRIFQQAYCRLQTYTPRYDENKKILASVQKYLAGLLTPPPAGGMPGCPGSAQG